MFTLLGFNICITKFKQTVLLVYLCRFDTKPVIRARNNSNISDYTLLGYVFVSIL